MATKKGERASNRYELAPGHELRGMRIRLYPTKETEELLLLLQDDLRYAWNWLVSETESTMDAAEAYALRNGLVPPRPSKVDWDSFDASTEEGREAMRLERKKSGERWLEWRGLLHAATKDLPECSYRKFSDQLAHFDVRYDYQLLQRVISWRMVEERKIAVGSGMLQALAKDYFAKSARRKKRRKSIDPMPLRTRTQECFELGDFGSRGATVRRPDRGQKNFYNCRVKINGLKILGRLPGKLPEGRVLQGVSLRKEADGWWASIKVEVPVRAMPEPTKDAVGLDVGLVNMVAMSDGTLIEGTRGKEFAERVAGRQAVSTTIADPVKKRVFDAATARIQLRATRHTKDVIYSKVVKPLGAYREIVVEDLPAKIGQMGSSRISVMRTIVAILKQRYPDRVREVPPHYTSQDCSQCGKRSKETWSFAHGRYGKCPSCGHSEDRDVNAARNVLRKHLESLAA